VATRACVPAPAPVTPSLLHHCKASPERAPRETQSHSERRRSISTDLPPKGGGYAVGPSWAALYLALRWSTLRLPQIHVVCTGRTDEFGICRLPISWARCGWRGEGRGDNRSSGDRAVTAATGVSLAKSIVFRTWCCRWPPTADSARMRAPSRRSNRRLPLLSRLIPLELTSDWRDSALSVGRAPAQLAVVLGADSSPAHDAQPVSRHGVTLAA